jgi:DinB superfamily
LPIGKFSRPAVITDNQFKAWISEIEEFPCELKELVSGLSDEEIGWRYRPGGWTIKQVVHHCADSHMNSFIRFKLTLTEELPTVRPYLEDKWAELPDTLEVDITESLKIIEGLHSRWVIMLKSLSSAELEREFIHPDSQASITLAENIGLYAWHSNHHLAHIRQAIDNTGRFN